MKFKVGDKVKVTYMNSVYEGSDAWRDIGKVGRIVEIWEGEDFDWPIRVKLNDGGRVEGFHEDELTLFLKVGQQLLFEFMK